MNPAFLLPLAQTSYLENRGGGAAFIVILVVVIGFIVVNHFIKAYQDSKDPRALKAREEKEGQPRKPLIPSGSSMRRAAKELGFEAEQVSFLESYGRKFSVASPEHVLRNSQALDEFLKKIYQDIEKHSEQETSADSRTTVLFQIREYADALRAKARPISSTHGLPKGTAFTFITPEGEHFTSRIHGVEPTGLSCAVPVDGLGQQIRFKRGTKLDCFYYSGPQNGFTFDTRVLGYSQMGASTVMVVKHSDSIQPLPARRHLRKRVAASCDWAPVNIVVTQSAGKPSKQAVVSGRYLPGQVADLSSGGLSLRTANLANQGDYIKVDFSLSRGIITAIGRVVRANRLKGSGGVMHVQFAKISRKDINAILTVIYGYE